MDDWYTPEELGARLKIKPRTLQAQARRGKIPGAKKIGSQWRFDVSKIDAWLCEPMPIPVELMTPTTVAKLERLQRFRRR